MTKLTIIIPCYNAVGYLKRTVDSLYQSIADKDVSVIFVDDCSTDGSYELACSLLKDKENATVIESAKCSGGPGAPRNVGVASATSEYVWLHDADDYLPADAVSRVFEVLDANPGVDCVAIPLATLCPPNRNAGETACTLRQSAVVPTDLKNAANGPVSSSAQVFKRELYVPQPEGQACEHVAWHFRQFDKFETWAKVEGETPCYVWDRTNNKAISETVDFCSRNSNTVEGLAVSNVLLQYGLRDKWVSDVLRNLAEMYDVRHQLTKPWVKDCWLLRFRQEYMNMMTGHYVH